MKIKAAVLYRDSEPKPYSKSQPLKVEELELDGPGSNEVLVEIKSAGLCHSDLSVINGSRRRPLPMALGHEASGVVVEVGQGTSRVKRGDHVVFSFVPMCGHCEKCLSGQPYLCIHGQKANATGTLIGGAIRLKTSKGQPVNHHMGVSGFSTFTVAHEASLVVVDPSFPLDKAALFSCAIMTGVGAVVNTAQVKPGSSVAVFGMGGVGLSTIMGAMVSGAWPVIAVDIIPSKLEHARRIGATHALLADEDTPKAIRDLTDGGADYAFEAAGSASVLAQAYEATRVGGTTVSIGLPHPESELKLKAVTLVGEARHLVGSYMGSAVPIRDLPRFIKLYKAGRLPIDHLVTSTLSLEQINLGFDELDSGKQLRQIIQMA
jgi:Zn-dependent alcohol dehydrogenase